MKALKKHELEQVAGGDAWMPEQLGFYPRWISLSLSDQKAVWRIWKKEEYRISYSLILFFFLNNKRNVIFLLYCIQYAYTFILIF